MGISNVISLLGGVALFLFGMTIMGEALKKVAGDKLEMILYRLSSTPIKGILLGTFVTSAIQSSSATTVMVVGFVNSGMMKVKQAIGIIMGAIIGTSVTGWILCLSYMGDGSTSGLTSLLSTETLTAFVAVIGIYLRMFCKKKTKRNIGEILLGFAVLMYGMQAMSGAVKVLRDSKSFIHAMSSFANPLIGILIGIAFTAVIQSASASIGILQALSMTGAISFSSAYPIILGIGVGASVPVLLSAIGAKTSGKRTAVVYLIVNTFGCIFGAAVFYIADAIVGFDSLTSMTMTPVLIALTNTLVRIIVVVVLTPLIGITEKIICALIKDKSEDEDDYANIERLEERFLMYPAIAIEQSRMALFAMADKTRKNVFRAVKLLSEFDENKFKKVAEKEEAIDKYEDKLGTYLVKVTAKDLSDDQTKQVSLVLHTISDFERISDHAVNISNLAQEKHEKKISFSTGAEEELRVMEECLIDIVDTSFHAFVQGSVDDCYKIEPLKALIGSMCDELKLRHVKRVQKGECSLNVGFVFNDLLMNYERIADHCSNVAIAMIELDSNAFDTHDYANKVREFKEAHFDKYYEEYSLKYRANL